MGLDSPMKPTGLRAYSALVGRVRSAFTAEPDTGLVVSELAAEGRPYELIRLTLGRAASPRVLLSAGIHGDEPSGVEALCAFLEAGTYRRWLPRWALTILPCLNPWGYEQGTRGNQAGADLNREFKSPHPPPEVAFARSVLDQRFDLSLELHDDVDSAGYYLYETTPDEAGALGHQVLTRVSAAVPINAEAEIDGRPASGGVIPRSLRSHPAPWWSMALYALSRGTPCCLTLEAPGRVPMETRVRAHLAAIEAALDHCEARVTEIAARR